MSSVPKCRSNSDAGVSLRDLRRLQGLSQAALAGRLQVTQPHVAQLESQSDMHIQTLQRYVEALGGSLQLVVQLPDCALGLHFEREETRRI